MEENKLDVPEFLYNGRTLPVVDVRSPVEFQKGHIPDALNLPLFTNEERSLVGTLYLQKGSSEALMKALELIGPKLKDFAAYALTIAPQRELLLHCWRGGMRSNSMAWLLSTAGMRTGTLNGGYKSYRRYVRECFLRPVNLWIIGGMTGSGKSEVIEALESKGQQVVHLERLAKHKGSVFGGVGMPQQPTTEQFENDLYTCLSQLDPKVITFVEDESLAIGKVFIPRPFFDQMSAARLVKLTVPFDRRVKQLVSAYTGGDRELLITSVRRIERRLGPENTRTVTDYIRTGEMTKAVELVLKYYDKIYSRSMDANKRKEVLEIEIKDESADTITDSIITTILPNHQSPITNHP